MRLLNSLQVRRVSPQIMAGLSARHFPWLLNTSVIITSGLSNLCMALSTIFLRVAERLPFAHRRGIPGRIFTRQEWPMCSGERRGRSDGQIALFDFFVLFQLSYASVVFDMTVIHEDRKSVV